MSMREKRESTRTRGLQRDMPDMKGLGQASQVHDNGNGSDNNNEVMSASPRGTTRLPKTSNGDMNAVSRAHMTTDGMLGEDQKSDEGAALSRPTTLQLSKMGQTAETAETNPSTIPPSISVKDPSSSLSGGGEDRGVNGLGILQRKRVREEEAAEPPLTPSRPPPASPHLGTLHSRRKKASPEKFNTGHFEPVPLRLGSNGEPALKRLRCENRIAVSYNRAGTPRIVSITPTLAPPSTPISLPKPRMPPAPQLLNTGSVATRKFSLIHALCSKNDLLLLFISYLPFPSLLKLYCTSKYFHALFNRHHTAFILSSMRTWAPDADRIYPWRCYKDLCVKDPSHKQKSQYHGRGPADLHLTEEYQDLRDVPSLRWLQMVIWRQGVCKDVLIQLATQGLRCPPGTLDAVRRMWFIMDLPLNTHRIACIRSPTYLTNQHLYNAQTFFLKVDMAFTAPGGQITPAARPGAPPAQQRFANAGFVGCSLRELLTAERHLTSLWRVLRGWSWDAGKRDRPMTRLDVLRLWIRHKYSLPPDAPPEVRRLPILDIPWHDVGTASLERAGVAHVELHGALRFLMHPDLRSAAAPDELERLQQQQQQQQQPLYPHQKRLILPADRPREVLLRPEQLVLREAIRRQMGLHTHWVRMMLYGFVDEVGREYRVLSEKEYAAWEKGKRPENVVLPMRDKTQEELRMVV